MHEPGSVRTANNTADRLQTARAKKGESSAITESFLIILPTHPHVFQTKPLGLCFSSSGECRRCSFPYSERLVHDAKLTKEQKSTREVAYLCKRSEAKTMHVETLLQNDITLLLARFAALKVKWPVSVAKNALNLSETDVAESCNALPRCLLKFPVSGATSKLRMIQNR